MNKLIINGRLTNDMEVITTKKGGLLANFTIANNQKYGDNEKTVFLKCTMFGDNLINALEEYLIKGCKLLLEGELQIDSIDTKEGDRKFYTSLLVRSIEIEQFVNEEEKQNKGNRDNRGNRNRR